MSTNIDAIKEALRESLETKKREIFDRIAYYNYVLCKEHNNRYPYAHSLNLDDSNCCEDCGWIKHENEPTFGCGHTPSEHAFSRLEEAEEQYRSLNAIDEDTIDQIARGVEKAIEKHKTDLALLAKAADPIRIDASTQECGFSAN